MAQALQRDFLTELEDAKRVDSVEMQAIVNRLPAGDLLSVTDVATALNVSITSIYALIEGRELRAINARTPRGTSEKPYYRVIRVSVLNYIKNHLT